MTDSDPRQTTSAEAAIAPGEPNRTHKRICTERSRFLSYDDPVAVVDLVLYDLRRPAGEGLEAGLKLFVLPLNLDAAEALRFPHAGERKTALLGVESAGALHYDGVQHDHIFAVVLKGDDALFNADHVRRHADAAVLVAYERVQKVLRRAEVVGRGGVGPLGEEVLVSANLTDHVCPPYALNALINIVSALAELRKRHFGFDLKRRSTGAEGRRSLWKRYSPPASFADSSSFFRIAVMVMRRVCSHPIDREFKQRRVNK